MCAEHAFLLFSFSVSLPVFGGSAALIYAVVADIDHTCLSCPFGVDWIPLWSPGLSFNWVSS